MNGPHAPATPAPWRPRALPSPGGDARPAGGPERPAPWAVLLVPAGLAVTGASALAYLGVLDPAWLAAACPTPHPDKVLHALLFGGLALGLAGRVRRERRAVALGLLALGIAAEELAQGHSAARTQDPLDLAASLVGVGLAWALARALDPRRLRDATR